MTQELTTTHLSWHLKTCSRWIRRTLEGSDQKKKKWLCRDLELWFGKKRENKKKPGPKFWPVPSIKIIQMYSPVRTIHQVLFPCGVRFIMKETPDTLFLFLHHKSNPLVFNHVLCTVLFSPIMFQGTSHLWGQAPLTDGPLTLEQSWSDGFQLLIRWMWLSLLKLEKFSRCDFKVETVLF